MVFELGRQATQTGDTQWAAPQQPGDAALQATTDYDELIQGFREVGGPWSGIQRGSCRVVDVTQLIDTLQVASSSIGPIRMCRAKWLAL